VSEPKELGTLEVTERGFEVIKFTDRYGAECSLQQSSLAEALQPGWSAIWLGPDDAKPQILASQAKAYGVKTKETEGWIPYPVPDAVMMTTRMHLDFEQVKSLIATLQKWVDTGSFNK